MKKIILFSMAAMLLSLSLNAQLVPDNTKRSIKATKTLQSNSINAPKITLEDDEYYLGPYTNDNYTRATTSLGNFTSGQVQVGVVLEANEFSQYYGDQIVGFRFATANTYSATVYNFFCTFISERYIGVTGSWSSSFGTNGTSMTSGWHEAYLQTPIDFTPADSVVQMWIGYEYNQRSSTNNAYNVVAVNTASTTHEDLVYMSYSGSYGFYDLESYLGGDVAVQLIMKRSLETAEAPVFSMDENYTITATCGNAYHAYVNGVEVTLPYTVQQTEQEQTIVVTGYGYGDGMQNSQTVTQTFIVPALPVAQAPVFSMDGNYTITATCGNAYHAYVNGVEVTLPYTVQQTDEVQTIVVTGYGYGTGMQNSQTVTQTFIVPARPLFPGYTELGSFSEFETIDFTGIMFCDQPCGDTHENAHPAKYTYWLEEVLEEGSTDDPHKTNSIDIPVYKTGSDVRGYYNLSEIASDTDHHLQVDVINADVDLSLQNESMIYYYTLDRGQTRLPDEHIARLQNNANSNFYTEMSNALGYQGETYTATQGNPALIDRWDHLDVKTGEHNVDYMSYIPVIWAWGDGTLNNKRNDWNTDSVHNSYGSPYYKTGVGDVRFNNNTKIIAQTGTGSTAVWKDGDDNCCLYNVIIDATGYLPTTVNTVDYEPYMFRVWVEGNGLRDYVYENNQFLPADTHPTEILLYEGEYVDNGTGEIRLSVGSTGSDYSQWIKFGGLQNFTPTLRVRFYYKVPSDNVTSLRGGGRDFYAVEESGYQPNSETGIIETLTGAQVVSTTFVNMQGMQSSKPFDGVNIMVTRYSDGTTTTTKVIK